MNDNGYAEFVCTSTQRREKLKIKYKLNFENYKTYTDDLLIFISQANLWIETTWSKVFERFIILVWLRKVL